MAEGLSASKPKTRGRSNSALDRARADASREVMKSKSTVDFSAPEILETYLKIRDDEDPTSYMVLGYRGSKNKLELYASGEGGFDAFAPAIPEGEPCYAYFRIVYGDSGRSKFIFLTYVPESLSGLKKSAVMSHKGPIDQFFKFYQLTWSILDKSELEFSTLEQMLLKAGGANYSVQDSNKSDFSSYKTATKEFYEETEKKGDNVKISFHDGPLAETPMDISGRSMVANQSELKANIKDLEIGK